MFTAHVIRRSHEDYQARILAAADEDEQLAPVHTASWIMERVAMLRCELDLASDRGLASEELWRETALARWGPDVYLCPASADQLLRENIYEWWVNERRSDGFNRESQILFSVLFL